MNINYIGSKKSLKDYIADLINHHTPLNPSITVGEGFAGTGVMSKCLVERYGVNIICTDTEQYSWLICHVHLNVPFSEKLKGIIQTLNLSTLPEPVKRLVTNTYSPVAGRQYFTQSNALKIDTMREEIERMKDTLTTDEYLFLLASLIISADKVSNVSCVYGAYLKNFKKSATRPLILLPIHTITSIETTTHQVYNQCVLSVDWSTCDVVYFDPPYNQRQYGANYFILNFIIAYSEDLQTSGKTGITPYYKSPFSQKTHCMSMFKQLLEHCKLVPLIVMSYNNEGILTSDELKMLLIQYGKVTCYTRPYKKFKASHSVTGSMVYELLWVVETRKQCTPSIHEVEVIES